MHGIHPKKLKLNNLGINRLKNIATYTASKGIKGHKMILFLYDMVNNRDK